MSTAVENTISTPSAAQSAGGARNGIMAVIRHHFLVPSRWCTGWGVVTAVAALSLLAGVVLREFTTVDPEAVNRVLSHNQLLFWWGGIALLATLVSALGRGSTLLLGLGLTRSQVWWGSVLYAGLQAVTAAATVVLLTVAEWGTGGWFTDLRPMTGALFTGEGHAPDLGDLPLLLVQWVVLFWGAQVVGLFFMALWARWGGAAVAAGIVVGVVLVVLSGLGLVTWVEGPALVMRSGTLQVIGLGLGLGLGGAVLAVVGGALFRRTNFR